MLLAGGQGSRLYVLTENTAKPAVPFGGKYRIIDYSLSNCVNSGIDTVGILTQYQPLELNDYIGNGQPWDLNRNFGGVHVLPPYTKTKNNMWYKGTANAIYQNIPFIERYNPEYVLILSGDHIYKMDYSLMLDFHRKKGAECTIAVRTVPMSDASRMGIMSTDPEMRITEFEEKPKQPKSTLASMGIYIFTYSELREYLIKDAMDRGCRDFLIGIGGSATNDGGTGMLQALGFRFLDRKGNELGLGGQILNQIYEIDCSRALSQLRETSFTIACDVNNPFYGEKGAAYVFARQKGADDAMVRLLDEGLRNFAEVIKRTGRIKIDDIPGAGAAGGLGGGFVAFLKAELKPGIRMVLDALRFDECIRGADLIITGEGKLDKQTCMGKTPCGVLQAGMRQGIPVIVMGGSVEEVEALNKSGFLAVLPLLPYPVSLEQAMDKDFTCRNIGRALEQQLRVIQYYMNH